MQATGLERSPANATRAAASCEPWGDTRHVVLQVAHVCLAAAFLAPTHRAAGLTRVLLALAFLLATAWSVLHSCAGPDVLAWNATLFAANCAQAAYMAYRRWPPKIHPEAQDLYCRVFAPLRVGKHHFRQLVRTADLEELDPGETYAIEGVTASDERLSVLLSGKMKVTCEDVLLHFLLPTEFVDSPEWQSCATNTDKRFQVTLTATEPCRLLSWRRRELLAVLSTNRFLDVVMNNLIGKDITHKLYSLNEQQSSSQQLQRKPSIAESLDWWRNPPLPRSQSEDAIRIGTKGRVRSFFWRKRLDRKTSGVFEADNLGTSRTCTSSDPGPFRNHACKTDVKFHPIPEQQHETPV